MRKITSIAAIGKNNELGYNNGLIWNFKKDMKFFRDNTVGKTIVMGRKTFKSLPGLLPNRNHIVLTKQNINIPGVYVLHSLWDFLEYFYNNNEEIMVIGGASIYEMMLPFIDSMLLTEIDDTFDKADAFYPVFDKSEWDRYVLGENIENNIHFSHVQYYKKVLKK